MAPDVATPLRRGLPGVSVGAIPNGWGRDPTSEFESNGTFRHRIRRAAPPDHDLADRRGRGELASEASLRR